jgi:homoserine acetyltransferase
MAAVLPVTGAWRPGDEAGQRRFFTFPTGRPFALDTEVALSDVTIAYETWGTLDEHASNAILICHAWTGDSHAAGPAGRRLSLVADPDGIYYDSSRPSRLEKLILNNAMINLE